MSAQAKPSIVFCHGIWADGSSFRELIPALQAEGYETIAAQYGLDTPEADVETVIRTLGRVSSPSILVGHSYGGSVITAAGTDDRVAGLVYIAALAPDGVECFAGDLPAAEKGVVWATHYAPAADLFSRNAPGVAWKTKPSWYIVATQDRTVHPDLERFFAQRMNATTYEVESSHVAMLSHPEVVLDVIHDAAKAIREQTVTSGVA